jgi:hypothetical protein
MSSRPHAGRLLAKASAAQRAAEPHTLAFRGAGSLASALFLTQDTDRARTLITHNQTTDPATRAAALDLLDQLTKGHHPMKKITAPAGPYPIHGAHQLDQPGTPWWVDGTLYTDDPALLAYFERRDGDTVEDAPDGIPTDHQTRADTMAATTPRRGTGRTRDAQDPGARNYPNA